MKQFRKNKDGLYICEECGKTYEKMFSMGIHINKQHNRNLYRKKWILESNEDNCLYCGKQIEFKRLLPNRKYCSVKCSSNSNIKQEKIKLTNLKKYGSTTPIQNNDIKEKIKLTNLKKYGAKNPQQNKNIHQKSKETNLKRYGVEYPMQNKEIYEKSLRTRRLIHKFNNTNLTYQGSYELDFLEKFHDKINIENGPNIKYKFEGKNKVYHSDFYIPSKNLIVEIKSSYILTLDIEINEKKQACLNKGYDYILILDKNYFKFNQNFNKSLTNL